MFSRIAGLPLAQSFGGQTFLADVPIRRKTTNRQHVNFTGIGAFSQAVESPLWINNNRYFNYLEKSSRPTSRLDLLPELTLISVLRGTKI